MCGADYWMDDRLLISKINLQIKLPRCLQGKKVSKHLNNVISTNKLNANLNEMPAQNGNNRWTPVNSSWHSLCNCSRCSPTQKAVHLDWFDGNNQEIAKLLGKKHKLYREHPLDKSTAWKTAFSDTRHDVQKVNCDRSRSPGCWRKQKNFKASLFVEKQRNFLAWSRLSINPNLWVHHRFSARSVDSHPRKIPAITVVVRTLPKCSEMTIGY